MNLSSSLEQPSNKPIRCSILCCPLPQPPGYELCPARGRRQAGLACELPLPQQGTHRLAGVVTALELGNRSFPPGRYPSSIDPEIIIRGPTISPRAICLRHSE